MTDDLAAQFAQMQRYALALKDMVNSAQSQSPSRAQGSDATGAVRVVLGPDGIPTSFRVDRDYNRKIDPGSFGSAVLEAFQSAMEDRLSTWGNSLVENGWQQRQEDLQRGRYQPTAESQVPAAFRQPSATTAPRALDEVTEDVLRAFDNASQYSSHPRTARGTDQSGHLTIELSTSGMTSCTADGAWVSKQTAARLTNALGQALSRAREVLAEASEPPGGATSLDQLVAEALALLARPNFSHEQE